MGTVEDGLFYYDLGFGEQQLNPNSQVITSSSQTPRDFPKQTPFNQIVGAPKTIGGEKVKELEGNVVKKVNPKIAVDMKGGGVGSGTRTLEEKTR